MGVRSGATTLYSPPPTRHAAVVFFVEVGPPDCEYVNGRRR